MANKSKKKTVSKSEEGGQKLVKFIQGCIVVFEKVSIEKLATITQAGLDLDNITAKDMSIILPIVQDLILESAATDGPYAPKIYADKYSVWAEEFMPDKYEVLETIVKALTDDGTLAETESYDDFLMIVQQELNAHYDANRPKKTVFIGDIPTKELTALFTALIGIGRDKGKG